MSNINLIIEERPANIGNFLVGRLLPFRGKRMVGPFIFIDHMGPAHLSNHQSLDIGPHPHIGLSTLTYLFEGMIHHRDSLGSDLEIQPGEVNWMTSGKGIVHSERTPERLRVTDKYLHGLQIWVALPKEKEEMEPGFSHFGSAEIPEWEDDGVKFKLIAGAALGKVSPVPVYSPMYLLEIKTTEAKKIAIGDGLFGEVGMYILEGTVKLESSSFAPKQLLIAQNSKLCEFETEGPATLYLFGGDPLPEKRFIYWNFVSSNAERIEKAKLDWQHLQFPILEGETDLVPLPPNAFHVKST